MRLIRMLRAWLVISMQKTATTLQLTPEQEEMMKDACRIAAPREACGIIAGGQVRELTNHAPDVGTFHLRGSDIASAVQAAGAGGLDAIWHTHPSGDPLPSESDRASHPWPAAMVIATRTDVTIYECDPGPC